MLRRDWPFTPSPEIAAAKTMVDVLAWRAQETPERVAFTWLDGEGLLEETPLSYGALFEQTCQAAALIGQDLAHGDRVILLFDSGLDFLRALLGCQAAGLVPVPVMPPRNATPAEVGRVMRILADAGSTTVVTTAQIAALAQALPGANMLSWRVFDWQSVDPIAPKPPTDLALLQYTSGSTSAPKGVMVGHDNLLRNVAYIYWGENCGPDTVSVSWLPMTHDMGLVEGIMKPLYAGHPVYLFHPLRFIQRPVAWLEVIARTGAEISGGPNFAYDLVLRRLAQAPLPKLDLSRWRFAYNGSEPVRADTVDAFCARMAPLGFQRQAYQALYGMAEATLGITAGRIGGPRIQARLGPQGSSRVVSCGVTPEDLEVVVVDPSGQVLPNGSEGEIWLSGPCVARGYWRKEEATDRTFGARIPGSERAFLRTGDLGFVLDDEVFVTGRIKELIIRRGANVHPQDLENTAEAAHPLLRFGGSVAFGVEQDGQEAVVLVAEVQRKLPQDTDLSPVLAAARQALARDHGVVVHHIALVPAGTVPRTTSGKRQRARVSKSWQRGKLPILAQSAPSQDAQDLAQWLPERVAALLGRALDALDPSRTLPELGLSSLAVIELLAELESRGASLSLGALLTQPLSALQGQEQRPYVHTPLHPSVQPQPGPRGPAILLTGATGFTGAHIAIALLQGTQSPLICLVRGAPERVLAHLQTHPDWSPDYAHRITPLRGDLSQGDLGLSAEERRVLAGSLAGIVHAAAMVNWVYPLSALAPSNVEGTRALLTLACQSSTPFVHLSTLACCWSLSAQAPVTAQTDPRTHLEGIYLPYVQSKALAESLVRQAGERGLPVSILRPGLIVADSQRGQGSPGDFLSSLFKGCIELGAAPDLDWELELCPVDRVAQAAVEALKAPVVLHLESPERRPWRGLVLWMALRGHPMTLLPYAQWCARLSQTSTALDPLQRFFTEPVLDTLRLPELYERSRRNPILAPNPPVGQPIDAPFLERSFQDLSAQGYLPAAHVPAPPAQRRPADYAAILGRPVTQARATDWPQGHRSESLIGELASWRHGQSLGVRRLALQDGQEAWTLVEKGQVSDRIALDIGQSIADLCGPTLGSAWSRHRGQSELIRSAERERALYALDLPAPRCLGQGPGFLLLEDLSAHRPLWQGPEVQAAIEGLGKVHGHGPIQAPWMPPERTAQSLLAQAPLWEALAEHALAGEVGTWLGPAGRARYSALLAELGDWAAQREQLPQTLIHNDFSPRNATIVQGALRAWDWELACNGLPQRDLAELLCFTSRAQDLPQALALHGRVLAQCGQDSGAIHAGFRTALAEFLVTRVSLYAMIHGFKRQHFLERVVRTWVALDAQMQGGQ